MKVYRVQKKYILGNALLFIGPIGLFLFSVTEPDPISQGEWLGILIFTALASLITFVPMVSKLEVGDDYLKGYFFRFVTNHIQRNDVDLIEYGNFFRFGGLGAGKGIKMWVKTKSGQRYQTVGEDAYGKDAIDHIRKALSKKN